MHTGLNSQLFSRQDILGTISNLVSFYIVLLILMKVDTSLSILKLVVWDFLFADIVQTKPS